MKKFILVAIFILILVILTSCRNSTALKQNLDVTNESSTAFQGEYVSSDESVLTITKNGDKYDIQMSIFRLMSIDDGIGKKSLSADEIVFSATDAAGNPIYGEIYMEESVIAVEFTKSTWEYLPEGTKIKFSKAEFEPTKER